MRNPIWDGARGSPDPERIHGPVLRDQSIHGQCWLGDEIRTRTHGQTGIQGKRPRTWICCTNDPPARCRQGARGWVTTERASVTNRQRQAVMLDIYLTGKGVRDPIRLAMMKAHVPAGIVAAPPADWDEIFKTF